MDELFHFEEKDTLHTGYQEDIINMGKSSIYVVHAEYAGDIQLNISFNDGTSRVVDFRPFLQAHPHPQYNRLINPKYFKRFSIENGNVVWGKNWDMVFPIEQLYHGTIA